MKAEQDLTDPGVTTPPTDEQQPCGCPLAGEGSPYEGHTNADHDNESCTGRWTWDPPCGGFINCDLARASYYEAQK